MAFTEQQQILFSQSIFDCLLKSELLAAELTGAARFDRSLLKRPPIGTRLNFEQKLGHLFEDAFAATIDAADDLSLIGRNVQLPGSDGQTLGEMDFLILNVPRQQPIHLELAVKFYLAHEDAQGTMQFPGPDARDNWPRKLKRLTSHQLRLTDLPAVRSLLLEQFEIKPPEVAHIILYKLHILYSVVVLRTARLFKPTLSTLNSEDVGTKFRHFERIVTVSRRKVQDA